MTREKPERLAASKDWEDRWDVAENPGCPQELLIKLGGDAAGDVRAAVAKNPNTPPEALKVLAGDEGCGIREKVARHPACQQEVLIKLSGDKDDDVRAAARKQLEQRERHRREAACADYAAELDAGSMGYGCGL